jgi:diguanylate cyclase (GGDEF)-like protein
MQSLLGVRGSKLNPSPLEGSEEYRAQQMESELRQLRRREWWLWLSACFVTVLSAVAFLLSSFRSFFLHSEYFYEIRSDQARWGILCLVLLFNTWMAYRQWSFRRLRRQLTEQNGMGEGSAQEVQDASALDRVTGLYTRSSIEQPLGKEIARARRQNTALSVATLHLDDFAQLTARYGKAATDEVLKEFARRLKEASRGSDFAVRLGSDDFLLVLPECNLGEAKVVLDRLGALEMKCAGHKIVLGYTTGWVDYQAGELPAELLKRAGSILHLYENAAKDSLSVTLRDA